MRGVEKYPNILHIRERGMLQVFAELKVMYACGAKMLVCVLFLLVAATGVIQFLLIMARMLGVQENGLFRSQLRQPGYKGTLSLTKATKSSQSSHDDEMDGLLQRSRSKAATPLKAIIAEHIITRYGPLSALILKPGGCWAFSKDVMTSMAAGTQQRPQAMDLGPRWCLISSKP